MTPTRHMGASDSVQRRTGVRLRACTVPGPRWVFAKSVGDSPAKTDDLPLAALSFDTYRNVTATLPSDGEEALHRWFLKNQYTWLHWYGKVGDHKERAEVPLQFVENRLYISWPPHTGSTGYLVFERAN